MNKPQVAVITATIGRDSLKRAIESIKEQTYEGEIKHVVISDGAGKIDVQEGVNIIIREERGGPGAARNTALATILGGKSLLIAFLDDDDWYRPDAINLLVQNIGPYDAVYGDLNFKEWDLKGGEKHLKSDKVRWSRDWTGRGNLKKGNFIPLPACLFKTDCFRKWGLFREDIGKCNDWELLSRFEANGAIFKHVPYIIGEAEWVWGKGTDGISTQEPEKAFPPTTWARITTLVEGNYI